MEEELRKIRNWASHGTPRQFMTEVTAKVSGLGLKTELEGDTLTVFDLHREGGFLGIGAKKVRDIKLQLVFGEGDVSIAKDTVDLEFLKELLPLLTAH